MVAFANSNPVVGDVVKDILLHRGLALGRLHAWLEPQPMTDDERRAAVAARLPPDEDLALLAVDVPSEWLSERSWSR